MTDGYRIYARFWMPENHRGIVLYLHGIQSHCGWYEQSANHLAEAGYAVLQVDRRGSGQNSQDRGQAESADQLIADTQSARDKLFELTGFSQYHMIGVSWGGKLATVTYVTDASGVLSLSLVTPGLFPRTGVSMEVKARIGFAMLYEPNTLFDIPLNDPEMFTTNPKWQHYFRTDRLTLRQCSAGFYLASRRMDKKIATLPKKESVPIHLLIAGDERIIENEQTIQFIQNLNWPLSQITTYEDVRHSLEFEPCQEAYYCDLTGFMDKIANHSMKTR